MNLGKAAHITAAAKGGPRYDPSLTREERRSIQNGIWLCAVHADLVDKDEAAFSVTLLRKWREQAEKLAATEAFTSQGKQTPKVIFELSEEDRSFLRSLALPPEDTTESILPRLVEAARSDIRAFIDGQEDAPHAIRLDLTLLSGSDEIATDLAGVKSGISVSGVIALVSPPGAGKTTTLIQLAESILESGDNVAVYLPLGEWEGTQDAWFDTLPRRNAFRSFRPQHFMQLAYDGRLVLLLDGWNELSPEASRRAHQERSRLHRDFPQLGVVLGSRQQTYSMDGPVVRLEPMNEHQQLDLARQLRGAEGEQLVDQAWRTPGLRELVTIPLYLKALLLGVRGGELPDTKDAILSSFVQQHESAPEKAILLRRSLLGVHHKILVSLASTANANGTSVLTEQEARRSVAEAVKELQARGQMTAPLQPATVLDTLTDSHLLVRQSPAGNVAFQHQQFQEWYASFRVEQRMLEAASGDAGSHRALRETVLDRPSWEESILFACERLSRKDGQGVAAVAKTVLDALGIDPMLAAGMIERSAPDVWSEAREEVMTFVGRWHTPGHADRAVKFMIMTGKTDFANHVWHLVDHPDDQVCFHAMRLANRFQPSVLGADAARRLAALPDARRGVVLAEIVHQSGYDGMELAADIASNDKNSRVVVDVLEALEFRGAMRHVTKILTQVDESVWQELAKRGTIRDLTDSAQRQRLAAMRRLNLQDEKDPIKQAHLLLNTRADGINVEECLYHVLISDALLTAPDNGRYLLQAVANRFPAVAESALVARLRAGQAVPNGVDDILDRAPVVDSGPIADAALKPGPFRSASHAVRRLIGPHTVGKLLDAFLGLRATLKGNKESSNEYLTCRDAIIESRQGSFLPALVARADTKDVSIITALADLLHLHGRRVDHAPMTLSPEERGQLVAILLRWSEVLLADPDATRHDIIHAAQAMQRVPSPDFVPILDKMVQRDMAETATEMKRKPSGRMSYDNWYRATLAAIGDEQVSALMTSYLPDLRFGVEAALVLLDMWNRDHPSTKERRFHGWYDYSDVKVHRDQMCTHPAISSESAEAIWEVIRRHGTSEQPVEKQRHAVKLACTAMRMPFGVNRPEVDALFKLPLSYAMKQDLFVVSAMSGVVLPATMLAEAVQELLREAQTQSWRLDENRGEAMTWIELFAFSDQPLAVLASLDLLPPDHVTPYRLRRLIGALGHSPHPDAFQALKALAERDSRLFEDDDWLDSLFRLNAFDAARTLLDILCNGMSGHRHSMHLLSKRLLGVARTHSAFRTELIARYREGGACKTPDALEEALLNLEDPEAILAVLHGMSSRGADFDSRLSAALRKLAIGETPSQCWPNAVALLGVPLATFRRQVFALMADEKLAALARRCLEEIDAFRDEYGRVNDEPRHPDITSGRPWPMVP